MDLYWQTLLSNMLPMLVIAFLPRSKHLLILWLQSLSAVILEPKKIKSITVSIVSHLFAMKRWEHMPWSFFECWVLSQLFHSPLPFSSRGCLVLQMLGFKHAFSFSSFTLIKRLFSSSSLSAIRVLSSTYLGAGNGNPLQYSCLENPRDRGAWWAAVYGVAQSRTRLKQLSSSSSIYQDNLIYCCFFFCSLYFLLPFLYPLSVNPWRLPWWLKW